MDEFLWGAIALRSRVLDSLSIPQIGSVPPERAIHPLPTRWAAERNVLASR